MSPRRRRWPTVLSRPASGWSSLLFLLAMLLVVGLAVVDERTLALGPSDHGLTPLVAILSAGLVNTLLARSRIGLVRAHVIGALAGAAILLLAMAATLGESGSGTAESASLALLHEQLKTLSDKVQSEVRMLLGPDETRPLVLAGLILGAIAWSIGQFSAFSVFRYRRAGPAIVASGSLLVLNEALPPMAPSTDDLPLLWAVTLFVLPAMLLLMRLQYTAQAEQWSRRQIVMSAEVERRFLQLGAIFVVLVIAAATSLAAVARVPAQPIDEGLLRGPLEDLREEVSRWLRLVAVDVGRPASTTLDDRLRVADDWDPGGGVAFSVEVAGGLRGNYWWLSAFSDFDGQAWSRGDTTTDEVAALAPLEVPPDSSGAGPFDVVVTLTPRRSSLAFGTLIAPSEPRAVSRDVLVRSLGDREGLTEITFSDEVLRGASYSVDSAIHDYQAGEGSLTASILRALGTDYPAWIDRYLRVDDGASGPRTARLATEITLLAERAGLESAYDKALLLQDRLRTMDYSTSVAGLCRPGENVPECLLRTETGFCQHFASTMVMALRELEVPARLVSGYLPGELADDGRWDVPQQASHVWVEAYFVGVGWVRFDPTPGEQLRRFAQLPTDFAEGEPVASPGPDASAATPAATAEDDGDPTPSPSPAAGVALQPSGDGAAPWSGLFLGAGVAALALLVLVALLLTRLRRLPGADDALAYSRIAGLAARLGYGPHPAQTEFEYAASLSDVLPAVRQDLYLVAEARVEKRYGRRTLAGDRRPALRRAYARIRTALLRLGWRGARQR